MKRSMVSACVLVVLLGTWTGCENTKQGMNEAVNPTPPSQRIEIARTAYNSGNYRKALIEAERAQGNNTPAVRDEAYYLAGMSAHQLGQRDLAAEHLERATKSKDQLLAGQAWAELGLIFQEQGRYADAAAALLKAAPVLPGEDKSNALYYAAINQQKLGHWTQARTNLMLAAKTAATDTQRVRAQEQMKVTGYTLQVGAFGNEINAQKEAEKIASNAIEARLGAPRIVPSQRAGAENLHLVHVGQFTTYQTALLARTRLGIPEAIVVPLAGN